MVKLHMYFLLIIYYTCVTYALNYESEYWTYRRVPDHMSICSACVLFLKYTKVIWFSLKLKLSEVNIMLEKKVKEYLGTLKQRPSNILDWNLKIICWTYNDKKKKCINN